MPLGASAADVKVGRSDATVVAANEDAFPRAPRVEKQEREAKAERPKHARRGSSQSDAGFRFQNPYAFPIQTLPIALPTVTNYSF
ncbi:MAG: hypothetical protein DCC71_23895 [Proteobacteria bacterium]|nr:MAG: hypothetical protein DCC71_23895 [Pseudomonadota bacterium]